MEMVIKKKRSCAADVVYVRTTSICLIEIEILPDRGETDSLVSMRSLVIDPMENDHPFVQPRDNVLMITDTSFVC